MYLPRDLISHLYTNLLRTHHRLSPPVLVLAALEPDALCACRILTALFKRDYISHKIQPVSGYGDLTRAANDLVHPMKASEGGTGGVIVCLGVGALVDLRELLGLNVENGNRDGLDGIEVWVLDARRPWNLDNVFGGQPAVPVLAETEGNARRRTYGVDKGRVQKSYKPGAGGIIVFDDGDIDEELDTERDAFYALAEMPEVENQDDDGDDSNDEQDETPAKSRDRKRKSWSDREDGENESESEDGPPRQRRRSNSGSSISSPARRRHGSSSISRSPSPSNLSPAKAPSARFLRRRLLTLRRGHESVLDAYFQLGTSYSEPICSLMYSLASDLGRDDNDLLWLTIVGVSSLELSGQTSSGLGTSASLARNRPLPFHHQSWRTTRSSRLYALLRDEVRRLNLPSSRDCTASSPSDTSIRLNPDPRFVLLRHWSLYDSMLHSPYLASRLHLWKETGVKRLHKLLAKMGVSLSQCRQSYTHMDISLKKNLRENLLKYAAVYGLDDLVPAGTGRGPSECEGWGFVRSWGWKAQLSAIDVGVLVGAILEVGHTQSSTSRPTDSASSQNRNAEGETETATAAAGTEVEDRSTSLLPRFFAAYDALAPTHPSKLLDAIPLAQHLLKAILRTGTSLLAKHQIRHLRAFRMGVVKDGPDLSLFASSPAALVKLALWVGEAVAVSEREKKGGVDGATPLVLAALDEARGTYVVVGTGGGMGGGSTAADKERERENAERKKEKDKVREEQRTVKEEKRAARTAEKAVRELDGEEADEEEESDEDDSSSDEEDVAETAAEQERRQKRGYGRNRFGIAFTEVVEETNARVKIDSFDHCVVEVKKEDLGGFLEGLSLKTVVGR